jgi:histidinol-phosphate/aromatic aminotransferase/cobyric acid decarboxylase-like protein
MSEQISAVPGLKLYPSKANFLFIELADGIPGRLLRDKLLKDYGLMVRECSNKIGSSEQFLRLAVQGQRAVDKLAEALRYELPILSQVNTLA